MPAREYDKFYFDITEAIAKKLEERGIRLVSQALEERGYLSLNVEPLP